VKTCLALTGTGAVQDAAHARRVIITPTVFLASFRDGAGWRRAPATRLRPWVRAVLGNPLTWKDPRYPLLVNNSWGSGMQVDEAVWGAEDDRGVGSSLGWRCSTWMRVVSRSWRLGPRPRKFPMGWRSCG